MPIGQHPGPGRIRIGNPTVANGVSQLRNLASNAGIPLGMEAWGGERDRLRGSGAGIGHGAAAKRARNAGGNARPEKRRAV